MVSITDKERIIRVILEDPDVCDIVYLFVPPTYNFGHHPA